MTSKRTGPPETWSSEDYSKLAAELSDLAEWFSGDDNYYAAELCWDLSVHCEKEAKRLLWPQPPWATYVSGPQRPLGMRPPGATF